MLELRVATFGTGYFSQYHYDAWSRLEGARLVGLCGHRNRDRAEAIAKEHGVPEIFMNPVEMLDAVCPDLVDIITTPESHLELVRLVAERGIPAICQKPLAPTFAQAEQIVEIAERADSLLVVHENWRFRPWFREAKRLLDEGLLGQPFSMAFRMRPGDGQGPRAYLDRQPYFQKMPRFLIHETGIHMIDVFRFLMGKVHGLFARLRRLNPVIAGEDAGYIIFDFPNETSGLFDGNRLSDFPAENTRKTMGELLLEGSEARVRLDGYGRLWLKPHGGEEREHAYSWRDRGYGGDAVYNLQRHVIDHLRNGAPVENRGRDYLRNLVVEEAVYRSNEEGRWIDLAP